MTRLELLAQPQWEPLLHLPGFATLSEPALRAADSFFGFVAEHGLADPQPGDVAFWASSNGELAPGHRIKLLSKAMTVCIPGFVSRIDAAIASLPDDRATTRATKMDTRSDRPASYDWDPIAPPSRRAPVSRQVSVHPWELPEEMQQTLRQMARGIPGNNVVVSPSIVKRLREKLCQFAWSARQAGLPVTLSDKSVWRYQEDVTARSALGTNGLRWATVRASIEEIGRFARYTHATEAIRRMLADCLGVLESRERRQKALKHAALARTGNTTLSLLDEADNLLEDSILAGTAKKRHQLRNGACILGIYPVAPLRNASAFLIFGQTLFWRNDSWVIDTEIQKTVSFNPDPFVMTLKPQHGRFVDAVLLGDQHPRYLPRMREEALDARRPLFALADGRPAAPTYVPRIFKALTKNSFTTTRTMLHTDLAVTMGISGREIAMTACHQISTKIAEKYETDAVAISAIARRQGAASARRSQYGVGRVLDL